MKCFDCDHEMKVLDQGKNGSSLLCPKCKHISIVMHGGK